MTDSNSKTKIHRKKLKAASGPKPALPPGTDYERPRYRQEPPPQYHYQPYRKLYRATGNKWLGGVCGGLAGYFNKDPVLIRLMWVVLTLLSAGVGIIAYILFWLFVDKEPVPYSQYDQQVTYDEFGRKHVHHYHMRPT